MQQHVITLIESYWGYTGYLLSSRRLQNPAHDGLSSKQLETESLWCQTLVIIRVSLLQGSDVLDQRYPWTGVFWWACQGRDRSRSTAGETPGTELGHCLLTTALLASSVTSRKWLPLPLQEHRTEIDARAGTFQAFEQFGQQLLVRDHYASPEIQQKLEALDRERADLEKAWVQRRMMLDQCLELQVRGKHQVHHLNENSSIVFQNPRSFTWTRIKQGLKQFTKWHHFLKRSM